MIIIPIYANFLLILQSSHHMGPNFTILQITMLLYQPCQRMILLKLIAFYCQTYTSALHFAANVDIFQM